jgi:hypothetical protein
MSEFIPEIVLTSICNFQDYIIDNIINIYNLHTLNGIIPFKITIITEQEYFDVINEKIMQNIKTSLEHMSLNLVNCNVLDDLNFSKLSKMDKTFRNGFWHLCKLRLIYLYSYMKMNNLKDIIHIENDVMIYQNLRELHKHFKNNDGLSEKLLLPFDCQNRAIISIMFIPEASVLHKILDKNITNGLNDMEIIPKLYNQGSPYKEMIGILPIAPLIYLTYYDKISNGNRIGNKLKHEIHFFIKNYLSLSSYENTIIFDAAAIGQYIGGVDPRNIAGDTRGFINETCIVDYSKCQFIWRKNNNIYQPFLIYEKQYYPIANLHIHCKKLSYFMCHNPIEQKLIGITE